MRIQLQVGVCIRMMSSGTTSVISQTPMTSYCIVLSYLREYRPSPSNILVCFGLWLKAIKSMASAN